MKRKTDFDKEHLLRLLEIEDLFNNNKIDANISVTLKMLAVIDHFNKSIIGPFNYELMKEEIIKKRAPPKS